MPELSPVRKKLIYLLFALSGFCALVYEVLWSKYLSLTFGNTMWAVSIVTATFMAGLALGSFLLGRYSTHPKINLLRLYAILEVGVAVTALLFAPTLHIVEKLYVFWAQVLPKLPWLTQGLHLFFCAMLLMPPAILMGGTFPVMCRLFARRKCGGQIGRLYAMNTLGATLGTFAAGFWLIPALGLSWTGYLAVALNLTVAEVAYLLARNQPDPASTLLHPDARSLGPKAAHHRPVLIGIGLVGLFSLAYEVLWTRVLLLFLGNTVYAFSLMLSAFLVGISLGGALYARLARPEMNEKRLFCLLSLAMGLAVLAMSPFYDQLALAFQWAHDVSGEHWGLLSFLSFLIVFVVVGPPTILSGALLPAAVAILDPGQKLTGAGVGLVVLYNTLGAVLGSLAAGFMLVPLFGLLESFQLLALINAAFGIFLLFHYRPAGNYLRWGTAAAALLATLLYQTADWNNKLMNSGVYCYAAKYRAMGGMKKVLEEERILEVIEGRGTTVAIHESLDGSQRFFTVNGKTDGGTGRDMSTQVMVGHLPLLAHREPHEVLVIGLGTGITLRGLTQHPVRNIDCVEISPEVVEAERYFREANGHALEKPQVKLIVQDGRHLLLTRKKNYDVIISEPSNPWQVGNASLFTHDFYRLAASRLAAAGIFCQWIGLYDITPENLRIAFRTFVDVFPHVQVFKTGADIILLGSQSDFSFDYQSLAERLTRPEIRKLMAEIEIRTPGDLIARHYLFGADAAHRLAAAADRLNTDDRPVLEFSARFNLGEQILGQHQRNNMNALLAARKKAWLPLSNLGNTAAEAAAVMRELGKSFARAGMENEAAHFMRRAAEIGGG